AMVASSIWNAAVPAAASSGPGGTAGTARLARMTMIVTPIRTTDCARNGTSARIERLLHRREHHLDRTARPHETGADCRACREVLVEWLPVRCVHVRERCQVGQIHQALDDVVPVEA